MTLRSTLMVLLAVVVIVSAIELSTWARKRAKPAIVPSASVSELDTAVPQASEVDAPAPSAAPALTW